MSCNKNMCVNDNEIKNKDKMSLHTDLKDLLNNLTKTDLNSIRKNLKIKGASKLVKADLIDVLDKNVKENFDEIVSNLNFTEYLFLNKYFEEYEYINSNIELFKNIVTSLRDFGLAFKVTSKKQESIVIPEDIESIIKEKIIKNEQFNLGFFISLDVLKIVSGVLYYYGTLEFKDLYEIVLKISKELNYGSEEKLEIEFDKEYLINLLNEDNTMYYGIKQRENRFYYNEIEELDLVISSHNNMRYIPYPEITLKDIDNFKDEYEKCSLKLREFLKFNFILTQEEIQDIIDSCITLIKNGFVKDSIADDLSSIINIEDKNKIQELNSILSYIDMNIRKWSLKGYTEKQAQEIVQVMSKKQEPIIKLNKIGRNDPCPCGSGKKYKKCCMNK